MNKYLDEELLLIIKLIQLNAATHHAVHSCDDSFVDNCNLKSWGVEVSLDGTLQTQID